MISGAVTKIIFLSLLAESFELRTTPIVNTNNGPVQGQIRTTPWNNVRYEAYKGIPYAKAPTGNMRFMPPVDVDPWNETLLAFEEGSVCPQYDFVFENLTGSEDCLYLNVYTPERNIGNDMRDLRSVMVYIHGGTFKSGYGNSSLYGPEYFIEEGVVVVTFNYRLGAAGFLSLGHPNASGNAGLKDQVLVLKWVQKNIEAFGGDPKNVTLFGQSAGGVAVDLHLVSHMSQGYFQSSISMSASAVTLWGYHTPNLAKARAISLAKKLNCNMKNDDTIVQCLCNRPIKEIVRTSRILTRSGLVFLPTAEVTKDIPERQKFLSECPYALYKAGKFKKQNHMTGWEKNEVLLFVKSLTDLLTPLDIILDKEDTLSEEMPGISLLLSPSRLAVTALRKGLYDGIFTIINILTDVFFVRAIDLMRKLYSENNPYPIYSYKLTFETPYDLHILFYDINVNGSAHGDDFGYIFRNTIVDIPVSPTLPDNRFRKTMVRLWANFAKYGNPTPPGIDDDLLNFVWPDWTKSGQELVLDNQPFVTSATSIYGLEYSRRRAYAAVIDFAQCGTTIGRVVGGIL